MREILIQAWQSVRIQWYRSLMTMTGVAWGIVTVVILMSYGNGFQRAMEIGIRRAFSSGTVVIFNGQTSLQAGGERAGRRIRLKESDIEPLRQLGAVKYVSPENVEWLPLSHDLKQTSAPVRGSRLSMD